MKVSALPLPAGRILQRQIFLKITVLILVFLFSVLGHLSPQHKHKPGYPPCLQLHLLAGLLHDPFNYL